MCRAQRNLRMFELPGRGKKTLGYRERLLLEYHNGPLAGHLGRERTYEHLSRDFWWEGMYEDVRRWCKTCQFCTGELLVPNSDA